MLVLHLKMFVSSECRRRNVWWPTCLCEGTESSCVHRRCDNDAGDPLCHSSSLVRAAARRGASQRQRTGPGVLQRQPVLVEAAKGSQCRLNNALQAAHACSATYCAQCRALPANRRPEIWSAVAQFQVFLVLVTPYVMPWCMLQGQRMRAVQQAEFLQEDCQTQACRTAKELRRKRVSRQQTIGQGHHGAATHVAGLAGSQALYSQSSVRACALY